MWDGLNEFIKALSIIWRHKLVTIAEVDLSFGNLFIALVLLLFATRLARLLTRLITRRLILPFVPDKSSQSTYETFAFYGSLVAFVAFSLTIAGIPLTVFTVVGGALAIGVGFGSQNIVNNFISGIILLVEKPIKVGDVVEVDSMAGTVLSIGTRSTKIKTIDSKVFIVPNSFFLEKSVLNWSYQTPIVRTNVDFGVAYGSNVKLLETVCLDVLLNTEGIEQDPFPLVVFHEFADSSLNFQLIFHCNLNKVSSMMMVRSAVRFKLEEKLRAHKIEMAFPQRDVHLKLSKALEVKVTS
jgi:potassium-dependent mechanosensitive channel